MSRIWIPRAWLAAFDAGMERSGLKPNSRAVHLRNLRAVFNYCIACGYTSLYPFRKFRLPHERTVKRSLSVERLRMLMSMEVEPWQEKYRDLFVLMFYLIGINAADLFPCRSLAEDGRLEYRRSKTGKPYSVKVEPEAMEIIGRYRGKSFLLDVCDRDANYKAFMKRMNRNLRVLSPVEFAGTEGRKRKKVRVPLFPASRPTGPATRGPPSPRPSTSPRRPSPPSSATSWAVRSRASTSTSTGGKSTRPTGG